MLLILFHVIFLKHTDSFIFCNDFTHTMPILMLILIHYLEHLQYFHKENLRYQIYQFIFAIVVNVFYTFWDEPVYPFITYNDVGTALFLVGGFLTLIGVFIGMTKITAIRSQSLKT